MWHGQSRRDDRVYRVYQAPPLKQRVYYSNCGLQPQPPSARGVHQYKEWDKSSMCNAMKAVIEEGVSIRKASLRYGIPKSTLGDRISGRVLPGSKSGPPRLLNDKEEKDLEDFIYHCSLIGYGKTRKDIICLVNRFLVYRGVNRSASNGWWSSYAKRHPSIVLRTPASIGRARYLATNRDMVNRYFDLLEETISKSKLKDKPCQIYNMDESGMPLNPKPLKTLNKRGGKET